MNEVEPDVYRNLKKLLQYEGDVEHDFEMTFSVPTKRNGNVEQHELLPDGDNIAVTSRNREKFAELYATWLLRGAVQTQLQAFAKGFRLVAGGKCLSLLSTHELEMLLCGEVDELYDLSQLQKVTNKQTKKLKRCSKYFYYYYLLRM